MCAGGSYSFSYRGPWLVMGPWARHVMALTSLHRPGQKTLTVAAHRHVATMPQETGCRRGIEVGKQSTVPRTWLAIASSVRPIAINRMRVAPAAPGATITFSRTAAHPTYTDHAHSQCAMSAERPTSKRVAPDPLHMRQQQSSVTSKSIDGGRKMKQ
mgnify:CR=1 FL=1|mmetsp:Transcript_6936/g.10088  ORF Transcript_6936/g.10088 Transcript_6936/m.10088 type:complete len:157 (+) Transcript_6936:66-536(+)